MSKQESVSQIILEFDGSITGFAHLASLVAGRYNLSVTGIGERKQRITFPPGQDMAVIQRGQFEQAKCGLGWGLLADFVVKSGHVQRYDDGELVIGLTAPESEASYKPHPNERAGAQGAAPPAWSSSVSMRNTRPQP